MDTVIARILRQMAKQLEGNEFVVTSKDLIFFCEQIADKIEEEAERSSK